MSPRAPAMSPSRRRAELVDVTIDLLRSLGQVPTTQEIATHADVAEGTIFRAFGTKDDLLSAVVERAFCPIPLLRVLADVDGAAPLERRLVAIASAYQQRYFEVFEVMVALGLSGPPPSRGAHRDCSIEDGHVSDAADATTSATSATANVDHDRGLQERVLVATVDLVERDAEHLRMPPRELVDLLRVTVFAGSHTGLNHGATMDPARLVDILLHGATAHPGPPSADPGSNTASPTPGGAP